MLQIQTQVDGKFVVIIIICAPIYSLLCNFLLIQQTGREVQVCEKRELCHDKGSFKIYAMVLGADGGFVIKEVGRLGKGQINILNYMTSV